MVKRFIDSIAIDKKDHIILGLITGFPLILLFGNIGGLVAILLVALKELLHDKLQKKGNPELLDFIASAVPIIMLLVTYNL